MTATNDRALVDLSEALDQTEAALTAGLGACSTLGRADLHRTLSGIIGRVRSALPAGVRQAAAEAREQSDGPLTCDQCFGQLETYDDGSGEPFTYCPDCLRPELAEPATIPMYRLTDRKP